MNNNHYSLKPKTSKNRTDNACVVSTQTACVVSPTRALLALLLALLLLPVGKAWGQTTVNYNFEGSDRNSWSFVNGSASYN